MKSITEILNTKPNSFEMDETVTIMAMVRTGKTNDKLEIGVGVSGKWLELAISQVKKAKEVGVYKLQDQVYKVVDLEIARPQDGNIWFDYLALVISRLNKMPLSGCCNKISDWYNSTDQNDEHISYRIGGGTGVRTKSTYWRLACWWNGYDLNWCENHGM